MPKMSRTKFLKGPCGQCGGNIEFPVELIGTTIECPHCGKPAELLLATPPEEPSVPRRVIVWTAVAVIILGIGLGGALVALHRAKVWAARQKQEAPAPPPPAATNETVAAAPPPETTNAAVTP